MAFVPPQADTAKHPDKGGVAAYSWIVFALTFGLLISDWMARQVLNAVFPLLKAEWALSDGQLGALSGVVALMVGLLTFPLSLLADRWGRIKSLTIMAVLWSLATLLCGIAENYGQMLAGRILVGVGEAAYGSVGIAVLLSVFPVRMRATVTAAFMAGGLVGQVLGVAVGGQIAATYGWRMAFNAVAIGGLVLALLYPLIVTGKRMAALGYGSPPSDTPDVRPPIRSVIKGRALKCAYIGGGLQLYVAGAVPAWLPSFFGRYYDMDVKAASGLAALIILPTGAGMVLCGMLSDRMSKTNPMMTPRLAITYCLLSAAFTAITFALPVGPFQIASLCVAAFFAASTTGPTGAMVANLTPIAIHGTAFATMTLANNLLGLAPGPIITGRLADSLGLLGALQLLPLASLAAALAFFIAKRSYTGDLER